ncbi:MAG: hypothetical protein IJ990_07795 [Alistipes sp.]|nr:hypothetical protein [Alistipes sp.]
MITQQDRNAQCATCDLRKFNPEMGIVCGLTNAKADFEEACPNYTPNKILQEQQNRIEQQSDKEASVGGWLAFFLWVGLGGGATVSFFSLLISGLYNNPLSLLFTLPIAVIIVTIAVLAIIAFYRRKSNAVSLAYTYLAMAAIDGVAALLFAAKGVSDIAFVDGLRPLIWATIWACFLHYSSRVAELIPEQQRTWGMPERILLGIYLLVYLILISLNVAA